MEFTPGIQELLLFLRQNDFDIIIASDSNSLFIQWILEKHNI